MSAQLKPGINLGSLKVSSPLAPDANLQVELISDPLALDGLSHEWNELVGRSTDQTPFQTYEWMKCWWQAYGKDRELFLVVMHKKQQLIGVAPLYREKRRRALIGLQKVLRFIGDGSDDADSFGMIFDARNVKLCVQHLFMWLDANRREWDILELNSMPEGSEVATHLISKVKELSWIYHQRWIPHLVLDLPATWEQYLAGLTGSVRRSWEYLLRRSEKTFTTQYRCCKRSGELLRELDVMMELHQKRWRRKGAGGKFALVERKSFYRLLSNQSAETGAVLHLLEFDGKVVSAIWGLVRDSTYYRLQSGYDTDFSKYSVGVMLQIKMMEELIGLGVNSIDFLAGDEKYKLECGAERTRYMNLSIAPNRTAAGLQMRLKNLGRRAKAKMRRL